MSGQTEPVTLDEFLKVASTLLGTQEEVLATLPKLGQVDFALAAPNSGIGNEYFYPTIPEKAAALLFGIIQAHALPDANKRSAWVTTNVWLRRNGFDLTFDEVDAEATITTVASSVMSRESLTDWLAEGIVPLK